MYDVRFLHRLVSFVEKGEHRPAGGQPFRDVAARTAGAEHPTTVFVGCGACKIVCLKVQSDSLTNLAQSTALGKYAGRVLKACCASYA